MFCVLYLPVFSEKDDIVLPERRRGLSTPDQVIIAENGCKIIGLKVIDLLESDKIHRISLKQPGYQFFAMFPGIGPILCQAETKIECHHGKVVHVEMHDGMDSREKMVGCQIELGIRGFKGLRG